MKVSELLFKYQNQSEDDIDVETLLEWLRIVEGKIKIECIDTHEGYEDFIKYDEEGNEIDYFTDFGMDSDLIVDNPYHDLYIYYFDTRLYQLNKEVNKYNSSIVMFRDAYLEFQSYYNRMHKPLSKRPRWINHMLLR